MDKDYVSIRRLGRFLTQLKGLFVQKVSGKGLSTEDYTTAEKTKLAGIASGAEVNVIEGVQVNGTDLTPDTNRKVNVVVPENVAHKVSGATSGNFAALNAQGDLTDSGKDASDFGSAADVEAIKEKIPTQASGQNQLADKNFVNSSVQTATANYRGSWDTFAEVPTAAGDYPADYAGSKKPTVNDYMVVLDCSANEWVSGNSFMGGDIVKVTTDLGTDGLFLCKGDIESTITPMDDPYHWEPLPHDWFEVARLSNPGTWRFKYSGNWDSAGISGWLSEYQVNEEPLTAAQIAALNSNITKSLTTKLQGLPSKPVDTAAQTLSDAEKAQARTNIGATAPEVFWAVYGSTTYAEIVAAENAGKICALRDDEVVFYRTREETNYIYFVALQTGNSFYRRISKTTSVWSTGAVGYELLPNKVTSWQSTPDDTHYPAEKLVKDSLDAITPFIGTYRSTTSAEIAAALNAGKRVWVKKGDAFYQYATDINEAYAYFVAPSMDGVTWLRLNTGTNVWAANVQRFQNTASKVTSLSASSTNNEYPSAKAVYDELQGKQPLIDSSHKLDYSLLDNTPTIPSAPVTMQGATASAAGSAGYAPAPAAGDEGKFLRGDGTWQNASVPQEVMNLIYAGL